MAALSLSLPRWGSGGYAVEMVVGIALGVGIADALFVLMGGGTLQIAAIVAGSMVAGVVLGGSVVLVSEAGVSALLVVIRQRPGSGLSAARPGARAR